MGGVKCVWLLAPNRKTGLKNKMGKHVYTGRKRFLGITVVRDTFLPHYIHGLVSTIAIAENILSLISLGHLSANWHIKTHLWFLRRKAAKLRAKEEEQKTLGAR